MLKIEKVEASEIVKSKTKSSITLRLYAKKIPGNDIKTFVENVHPETAKLYPDTSLDKPYRIKYEIWEEESLLKDLLQAIKENNITKFMMYMDAQSTSFKSFVELCIREFDFSEAIV